MPKDRTDVTIGGPTIGWQHRAGGGTRYRNTAALVALHAEGRNLLPTAGDATAAVEAVLGAVAEELRERGYLVATATSVPIDLSAGTDFRVCGFCHGKPVGNAGKWVGSDGPEYLPCPRCGELNN